MKPARLRADILAGLTTSFALVPECIAFALVAHLNPLLGLYGAFIICTLTALFGGRPGMVSGAAGSLDPTRDTLLNVDAFGRPVPSSRFMGGREYEMLAQQFGAVKDEAMDAALGGVIANGMMLLPSVVSGSGPFPDKAARWIGEATAAERHAAASLYLALMTECSLSLIGRKGPILVEGPFASNTLYLKALAGFAKTEVTAVEGSTGTSAGAALLTGIKPLAGRERHFTPHDIPGLSSYRNAWRGHMA